MTDAAVELGRPASPRVAGLGPSAAFAGPAFLVAVGHVDPGNWGTDLA